MIFVVVIVVGGGLVVLVGGIIHCQSSVCIISIGGSLRLIGLVDGAGFVRSFSYDKIY